MEAIDIGIRILDAFPGINSVKSGIVESRFYLMKQIGAALNIGTIIKDHETISELSSLYTIAGEIGIARELLASALDHLERINVVRLQRDSRSRPTRVDVKIPDYDRFLTLAGDYFKTEVEQSDYSISFLQVLDSLSSMPVKEKELRSLLKIASDEFDLIKSLGKAGSLLDEYLSPKDSENILFSPLYWDQNPEKIFQLCQGHNFLEVKKCLDLVRDRPGIPGEQLTEPILLEGILMGALPTYSVDSSSGMKKFVFSPANGVPKAEKAILNKARTLIACIRYGENFASITPVFDPERLLTVLKNRGFLGRHSESLRQYEPARNLGIVKLVPASGRYEVHFVDNAENTKAADLAIQLLGSSRYGKSEIPKANRLVGVENSNALIEPIPTRGIVLKENHAIRNISTIQSINDIIRGANII